MLRILGKVLFLGMLQCAVSGAYATPMAYSFSTGSSPYGTNAIASLFDNGASVSGTFSYDSQSPYIGPTTNGSSYGGHSLTSGNPASFSSIFGTVSGMTFSDPRGVAVVGNDNASMQGNDFFQLSSDPTLTSTSTHNFSGFMLGGYRLVNARLFWIEGQAAPNLIGDFLQDDSLLTAPPAFNGRLGLDFIDTAVNPNVVAGYVFFDGLRVSPATQVSEPQTLAMLLTGLGLLALRPRRR